MSKDHLRGGLYGLPVVLPCSETVYTNLDVKFSIGFEWC